MDTFPAMSEADQKLYHKGVDIWLIRANLKLSYEARVAQHQNTLDCIDRLQQLKFKKHAEPGRAS